MFPAGLCCLQLCSDLCSIDESFCWGRTRLVAMAHPWWCREAVVVAVVVAVVGGGGGGGWRWRWWRRCGGGGGGGGGDSRDGGGGSGGSNGSTVSGDTVSADVDDEVSAELGEDEPSAPPQPAKPSIETSARNIPKHRDVNLPGEQRLFLLLKINISPQST